MKTAKLLTFLLGAALSCMAELAFAQAATVSTVSGTVQAIPNAGVPRTLRMGDSVNQGDTIFTGADSSAVVQFADGHMLALPGNSRAAITTYSYNQANPGAGKVLITLLDGGMRAVTGSIGEANPSAVTYRAGEATIEIEGTDITIATAGGNLAITVIKGRISFLFQGKRTTVRAGRGLDARTDGTIREAALVAFVNSLPAEFKNIFTATDKIILDQLIRQAGQDDLRARPLATPSTTSGTSSSGSGGGSASGR